MKITNYDRLTGIDLGESEAREDPLVPGRPLIPGYATPEAAPAVQAGEVAVYQGDDGAPPLNWQDGSWRVVADYRGAPLFRTADGSIFEIGAEYPRVGPLPQTLTTMPRPSRAHVWNGIVWEIDVALESGFTLADNKAERAAREARARVAMEPLQMAVDIDLATEEEAARLLAWKRYFVLLSRVDLANPVWPEEPAA